VAGRHGRIARRAPKEYGDPNVGFAWLRLAGATTVVIDHSSPLVHPERLSIFPASWNASPGYIALMAFFAMSGYQISDSWERDPSWWRFGARRLLRILPPLLFVVAVTVFVIGPLYTTWSLHDYWAHKQTWRYLVGTFALFLLQHDLPGVFSDNPYPWSVNGSLWTLPMEMVGYAIVLGVGVLVALGASRLVLFPLLAGMFVLDGTLQATFGYHGRGGSLIHIPIGSMVSFMVPFVIGMVLHAYRDRVPFRPLAAILLAGLWLVLHWTPLDRYLLAVMSAYGAIVIARHWPRSLDTGGRWVVGSYGMYIWAFPIQQMIIHAGVRDEWVLMAGAVPAAYLAGVVSWMVVEEPTQRWRRYLPRPRPRPSAMAAPVPPPSGARQPGPAAVTGGDAEATRPRFAPVPASARPWAGPRRPAPGVTGESDAETTRPLYLSPPGR
jgi:peptidoglycan/LPS O-acetylase OafA/YrhL